jgi:ferric-dicitrate binding protein FerR (iron transport regulator)
MEIFEIIVKFINNEADEAEEQQLEIWLKKDLANVSLFEELKLTWEKTGQIAVEEDFDTTLALRNVQEKIKQEDNVIPIKGRGIDLKWIARIAAVLVISFYSLWLYNKSNSASENVIAETHETSKEFILPDGSKVWLNANSKLIYPNNFKGDKRIVTLEEGEAFFDITHDSEHPFVIDNSEFGIKVLGTSFNVKSYSNSNEVAVTVATGTVAFKSNRLGKELILTKNELGKINKNDLKYTEVLNSDQNFMAWKTHQLTFQNQPLIKVCEVLNGYFHADIKIIDINLCSTNFTGNFSNPKLEDVLKVLENTLKIKVTSNQKQVRIYEETQVE